MCNVSQLKTSFQVQNWFCVLQIDFWFLKTTGESRDLSPNCIKIHEHHPSIAMGLHYSLRWWWMGNCEHAEMTQAQQNAQQQSKMGWAGPETWPNVLGSRIAPFSTLWLVRDDPNHLKSRQEMLPRTVASPSFRGKPRYDFVCLRQEDDAG